MAKLDPDQRLEIAMGNMLRGGVTTAALVVLAGGIIYLSQFHGPLPDYRHFHGPAATQIGIGAVLAGVGRLDSASLIELGILLLIATPICRVIFGVVGFALMRDWFFTAASAVVLAILLISFVLGR